ncbi:hypothetical protein GGI23_005248, partial [Coemansia sp. RSA 2559]
RGTSDTKDNKNGSSPTKKLSALESDPIMREYARKIVGEGAELPPDYITMILEARQRGREGLPQPHLRPHRCNKHLEDFIDGIFIGEGWASAKVYFKCVGSKMGEEPERYKHKGDTDPYRRR